MRIWVKSCDPARRWKRLAVVIVTPRDRRRWDREQTSMRVLTMLATHTYQAETRNAARRPGLTCSPPGTALGYRQKTDELSNNLHTSNI